MSEQDFPPQPPRPPEGGVPPVSVTPTAADASWRTPPVQLHKRSRAWIWWTVGIILGVSLVVGSCVLPVVLVMGDGTELKLGEKVGVIHLDGVIAGTGDSYSGYVTPEAFLDLLKEADEDTSVKAIVLRVDSPGGTVAASEEIARFVADCDKPVVVSSGDVNASGAYMVSSQADEIWALPGTAVGSIGVISEIPNVSGLMKKLGLEFTVITAGENKDTGSPFRALTEQELALIQGEVDEAYGQFIDIVAEGRDMKRSEVASLATGWTWSGERAKELGLVDEIGTYQDALDAAADAGGIEGDYDVRVFDEDLGSLFGSLVGLSSSMQRLAAVAEGTAGVGARPPVPK